MNAAGLIQIEFIRFHKYTGVMMSWMDEHMRNINSLLEAMPLWKRRVLFFAMPGAAQDNDSAVASVGGNPADNTSWADVESGGIRRFEMNEQLI